LLAERGFHEEKEMTVKELASLGGHARKKKLSAARRKEIAQKAIRARWTNRKRKAEVNARQGRVYQRGVAVDC